MIPRDKGTPQGGAISPLLANLFLHYAFDRWMAKQYPQLPFERFADDAIVHCRTEAEAQGVRAAIAARLRRNRGVSLAQVIVELNLFLVGWINYYRYAACRFELQCLDEMNGFGESCAAIASSNASAAVPCSGSSGDWECPRHRLVDSLARAKGHGVWLSPNR